MNIPTATYRLQFRDGMTFDRACEIIPYLKKLGISHLYASPIFTATTGSTHGYDVTNANEIDPAIGGREGFDRLVRKLKDEGLGLILDIVPNHMAASLENPWWRDAVEHGTDSTYAGHFDIDWSRRLTLPVLGQDFDDALDAGDITIEADPDTGRPSLRYFETFFPINPASYSSHEEERLETTDKNIIADIHARQPYRLMCWRDARKELSYRRFFEVTGLAGVRVEVESVFEDSHRLILELVRSGAVDGLRIDHVDGLADPKGYLQRLRDAAGPDCYITVEKILGGDEALPTEWPVSGTTGYEFIAALSDLFTEDAKLGELRAAYEEAEGRTIDMTEALRDAKALMADHNFAGEFATLLSLATEILKTDSQTDQTTEETIRPTLRELVISFPVYRTYGTGQGLPSDSEEVLTNVIETINKGAHPQNGEALKNIRRILRGDVAPATVDKANEFRTRFQQLTGPLMAKSVEDTLFYRQNSALALNEVGAEPLPRRFSLQRFHDEMAKRLSDQPDALSTTSTHDTKRGEDARARLYSITEAPALWQQAFKRWQDMNAKSRVTIDDVLIPEASVEWMLYQALVGVWPFETPTTDAETLAALKERFVAYVEKALREAKLRTNWGDSNEAYEEAVLNYARALLSTDNTMFIEDFSTFVAPFIDAGLSNSLAQTLIKLTAPGVPDIYQGCEGLDLSLVDPDNRRLPDFDTFESQLSALQESDGLLSPKRGPAFKQHIISSTLHLRKESPELFRKGGYLPLSASGDGAGQVVSFARSTRDEAIIVIAPLLVFHAIKDGRPLFDQAHIELPDRLANRRYEDVLTGKTIDLTGTLNLADVVAYPYLALLRAVSRKG